MVLLWFELGFVLFFFLRFSYRQAYWLTGLGWAGLRGWLSGLGSGAGRLAVGSDSAKTYVKKSKTKKQSTPFQTISKLYRKPPTKTAGWAGLGWTPGLAG